VINCAHYIKGEVVKKLFALAAAALALGNGALQALPPVKQVKQAAVPQGAKVKQENNNAVNLQQPVGVATKIASIDSLMIMQQSDEGIKLAMKIQKEIDAFQNEIKNVQKELGDMQESINKQAKLLSEDALNQKADELAAKRKTYERTFVDKEEQLRASIQKQQVALRERQMKVINSVSEKEGYLAMLDKNTPGLLFVSNTIDQTEHMLKAVNQHFNAPAAGAPKADNNLKTV
jgi:outer membrane protein